MSDYPHDPEQEAIDIRRAIVREQQASFENLIRSEERERIIRALEDDGERNYISQETYDYVVAIIKGENT